MTTKFIVELFSRLRMKTKVLSWIFVLSVQFFSEIEMQENRTEYFSDQTGNRTGSKIIYNLSEI